MNEVIDSLCILLIFVQIRKEMDIKSYFLKTFEKVFYLFGFLVLALIYFITYLKKGFILYQTTGSDLEKNTKSILFKQSWLL